MYKLQCNSGFAQINSDEVFGPEKAIPGMKRVVKDVLYEGTFNTNQGVWDVGPQTLMSIKESYNAAARKGVRSGLYWGNDLRNGQHNIKANDLIGDIEELAVVGDRLWAAAYVPEEDVEALTKRNRRVSVGVKPSYTDGHNGKHKDFLHHVAIVDHPVAHAQGGFRLANDDFDANFVLSELIPLIDRMNDMMELPRIQGLPMSRLPDILRQQLDTAIKLTEPNPASTEAISNEDDMDPKELANILDNRDTKLLAAVGELIKPLAAKVEKEAEARELAVKKTAFESFANRLFKENKVNAAQRDALLNSGESTSYNLSLLETFDSIQMSSEVGGVMSEGEIPSDDEEDQAPETKCQNTGVELANDDDLATKMVESGLYKEDDDYIVALRKGNIFKS